MSLALKKVSDYIAEARVLLQDTIAPYRYDDASLVRALNFSLLEGRRLRPDLFVYFKCKDDGDVQYFDPSGDATEKGQTVNIEEQFRQAFLNGLVGFALERDQEDIQDARSNQFLSLMRYMLTGVQPATPAPAKGD